MFLELFKSKGLWKTAILFAIAFAFGVNITPAKYALVGNATFAVAQLPSLSLPLILGMLLQDFLAWLATPAIIGGLLAVILSVVTFIPGEVKAWLVVVLSAAIGAAITAAIPLISPEWLNATVYQVILMAVSGIIAWLSAEFGADSIVRYRERSGLSLRQSRW